MRINTSVQIGEIEASVYITAEDVAAIFSESPECTASALIGLNNLGQYLKGITPDMIGQMRPGQRTVIANFLREHAARFEP